MKLKTCHSSLSVCLLENGDFHGSREEERNALSFFLLMPAQKGERPLPFQNGRAVFLSSLPTPRHRPLEGLEKMSVKCHACPRKGEGLPETETGTGEMA